MNAILVSKGDDPELEAYSGFQVQRLDLAEFLRLRKVERVFIAGLTADYCVRQTALDARAAGFTVFVVEDAVRGVAPDTTAQAFADMEAAGVMPHPLRARSRTRASGPPPPTTSTATRCTMTTDTHRPGRRRPARAATATSPSAGRGARTWRCSPTSTSSP